MIHILILNNNPIISKLIVLGLSSDDIKFIEINANQQIPQEKFDILFIDENYQKDDILKKIIEQVKVNEKILLSSLDETSQYKEITALIKKLSIVI